MTNTLHSSGRAPLRAPAASRWTNLKDAISEKGWLIALLMPSLAIFLLGQVYPLSLSAYLSLVDFAVAKGPTPGGFVGAANYAAALNDAVFVDSVKITLTIALVATIVELILGLLLAYLLVGEHWWHRLSRTILIMPAMIAPVAVGTMWRMMLNSEAGIVSVGLRTLGVNPPNWFGEANSALAAVIGVGVWEQTPFVLLIYAAALSSLPTDPIRAAQIDGASRWQIARYIILPLLFPVTMIVLMFTVVDSLMLLDIIYTTTIGGPGFATHSLTLWIYSQGLRYFNVSYAAAMSWMLTALAGVTAVCLIWVRSRWLSANL
jgi:multiple sugar transport system permease protein